MTADNPPYCVRHRYRVRLAEDAARGTRLLTLLTRDDDEPHNARLRYFLTGDHADHFTIDKVKEIYSISPFYFTISGRRKQA